MKISSLKQIIEHIDDKENRYNNSFSMAIIDSQIQSDIISNTLSNYFSNKTKSALFNFQINHNIYNSIYNSFVEWHSDSFGIEINSDSKLTELSIDQMLISLLKEFNFKKKQKFFLIFNYSNEIELEFLYSVLAQIRNLRDSVSNLHDTMFSVYSIVIGPIPYYKLIQICHDYSVSSVIEDKIYFNNLSKDEINSILVNKFGSLYNIPNSNYFLDYIYEITNGYPFFLFHLINNSAFSFDFNTIKNILEDFSKDVKIINSISSSFEILDYNTKESIYNLFEGRELSININSPIFEEIFLSGLFCFHNKGDITYIQFRNWFVEKILRENIFHAFSQKFHLSKISELIPPHSFFNSRSYNIILQIENSLRNLLIMRLHKFNQNEHPLKLINFVNIDQSRQFRSYYNYCLNERNKNERYNFAIQSSLSSYLMIVDFKNIFFTAENSFTNERGVYAKFTDIFPSKSDLENNLEQLRRIRNLIAHNNIIFADTFNSLLECQYYFNKSFENFF